VRALALALCSAALFGCSLFQPTVTVEPEVCKALSGTTKTACAAAGDLIVKGYVALASVNKTIGDNVKAGGLTKAEAQEYLNKSIDARKKLDKAYAVFNAGNYADALSQANITTAVLNALVTELAARAKK
jgi:hypothetical protein